MIQKRAGLSTIVTSVMFIIGLFLVGVGVYLQVTKPPSLSYPRDKWEFLWYKYTEDPQDPWGRYIKRTERTELSFAEDFLEGEVANTGESELIGFRASRTLKVSSRTRYEIELGSDDGIRLIIYDSDFEEVYRILSGWKDRSYTSYTYERTFEAGEYKILLEWYENSGEALFTFIMETID